MIKKEKKTQKLYFKDYNILRVQDLSQANYQIVLIIKLKELIKLNVNMDTMIRNAKHVELNAETVIAILNS